MSVMIIHEIPQKRAGSENNNLLKYIFRTQPLSNLVFEYVQKHVFVREKSGTILMPRAWISDSHPARFHLEAYESSDSVTVPYKKNVKKNTWFIIHHGRFITNLDYTWLVTVLNSIQTDIAAVQVAPQLKAFYEKTLVTSDNRLVGFRRFYGDSVRPIPIPDEWPHCLFIRTDCLDRVIVNHTLPLHFPQLMEHCKSQSLKIRGLDAGGKILDLNTEAGMIGLLEAVSDSNRHINTRVSNDNAAYISQSAKFFGYIQYGRNVRVESDAIIAGSAVLGDNVTVNQGSVIRNSIIGSGISIPAGCVIENRVLLNAADCSKQSEMLESETAAVVNSRFDDNTDYFRIWPKFSYAGFFKRIADIFIAICVLILFTPVMLIVSLVIKLTSPGPIFFAHKRQGLHGKEFSCLKCRTRYGGSTR